MVFRIFKTYEEMSKQAAEHIAQFINLNKGTLLCLAGGDTPLPTYRHLIMMQDMGQVDLNDVSYVMLDEWVGLGYETRGSCIQVMKDHFYTPAGIRKENLYMFDGLARDEQAECDRIDAHIASFGGIGLALLGIGMNGHIGFNEPGGPSREGSFVVELDPTTREVEKKYFDNEAVLIEKGMTVGYKTLGKAKELLYMASGTKKAEIVDKITDDTPSTSGVTEDIPAERLKNHPFLTFYLDKDAAGRHSDGLEK